jgi:hypothetical protein
MEGNKSLKEGAARLGVSPFTLRLWAVYQNKIPYVRLGRRVVFRPADLEAFERQNRVEARRPSTRGGAA